MNSWCDRLHWAWVEYHGVKLPDGVSVDEVLRARFSDEDVRWYGSRSERREDGSVERVCVLFWLELNRTVEYWRSELSCVLDAEQIPEMELKTIRCAAAGGWKARKQATIGAVGCRRTFGESFDMDRELCLVIGLPLVDIGR